MRKRIVVVIVGLLLILFAIGVYEFSYQSHQGSIHASQQKTPTITYRGENGKNALTLLKQYTSVEQDHSGLVVSISGTKADNSEHQYWAFYVNGKYSSVGPAEYVTKDSDVITWKIEKY